jgi:hypothetical protein
VKHKRDVCAVGLLLLVLLRQAHTRWPCSHARRLPIGLWQTNSWSKTIVNVNTTLQGTV